MRRNPYPAGWRCRPSGVVGRDRARPAGRPAATPATEPGRTVGCGPPGQGPPPAYGVVRVRFVPSDVPVLTCRPADRTAALRGAAEALARLGRSDLGGHLEVTPGPAPAERLAAGRAVENALRGGCGTVQVPPPPR